MDRRIAAALLLLLLPMALAAECEEPQLTVSPLETVFEGTLHGTLETANATAGAIPLGGGEVTLENGRFTLTPRGEARRIEVLFYAIKEGCVAAELGAYHVARLPRINATPWEPRLSTSEGKSLRLSVETDAEQWGWTIDRRALPERNTTLIYHPDYAAAGTHRIVFWATENGLTANKTWIVIVDDVNRVPYLSNPLSSLALPLEGVQKIRLSDYLADPDGETLRFTAMGGDGLNITINGSLLTLLGSADAEGVIEIVGVDAAGNNVTTSLTYIIEQKRLGAGLFCGDMVCVAPEDCTSCVQDCGTCDATRCIPRWLCEEWGACRATGYQFRDCGIINGCDEFSIRPPEAQRCGYTPRCDDGLKNGREAGVDCGGPCKACPTCYDERQNGGEEAVDCGGPCKACPTCDDGLKNGDESDVDCGGPCGRCGIGSHCRRTADCASDACVEGLCDAASCNDWIQNQGEDAIDCGGPCEPCASCNDGVRNGNEEATDCGGDCEPCPTCEDREKNQGETLPDCGGPCRACTLRDHMPRLLHASLWALLIIILLVVAYVLRALFTSRLIFLMQHGKGVHFFYEDQLTYRLVRASNALLRPLRRQRVALRSMVDESRQEISGLWKVPEEMQRTALTGKLRGLYAAMFGLSPGFELQTLVNAVKGSDLPFPVKVIALRNTKMLALLETTKLYSSGATAREETLQGLDELRKAL